MPKRLRSKTMPRIALPAFELEGKIMAPLHRRKSCRKLKGADFFYVGSVGQEPNWFARPVPFRVSKACRKSFVLALGKVRREFDLLPPNAKTA
jgi:hypothetical protein